jgi:regulator of sigma E protease
VGQGKIEGHLRREKIVLTTIYGTILPTIIVLGIIIFVHELGHFLLAKKLGVGVLKFSLGFGPKLVGRKIGETEYQIAVFPLGGFVKPLGEDPNEELKEEDRHRSLWAQPIWKRALIFGSGSFFNLLLAVAIFSTVNIFVGIPSTPPATIGEISSGLPAEKAGLKKGDVVLSVDGVQVSKWEELAKIIRTSKGKELLIKIKRNGEILEFTVTPQAAKDKNMFGEELSTFVIGIKSSGEIVVQKVNPFVAVGHGFVQTWQIIELTIVGVVKLIQRVIPAKTIGGPILIAQLAGEQAKRGLLSFALFMALISISIGVFNLFPIPILDGGHFLFLGLEAVLRRPISIKKMEIAQQVGLIFIILLMLFAFYNDLIRVFSPGGFNF